MKRILSLILTALMLAVNLTGCFKADGAVEKTSEPAPVKTKEESVVLPSKASGLELETYTGDGFSIKIPKGWIVSTVGDGVYLGINVQNPEDDGMSFFRYGKLEPVLKSQAARASWEKWGPITGNGSGEMFAHAPVLEDKTAKGILEVWGEFVEFQNYLGQSVTFAPLKNINVTGAESVSGILSAAGIPEYTANAVCETQSGKPAEISVYAGIADVGYMDTFEEGIDTYYMSVYELNGAIVPEGCDEAVKKSIAECLTSLEFSEEFINKANEQSDAGLAAILQRSKENEIMMDAFMIMWGYY